MVFHLACTSRPKTSNDNPALDLEENLVSTVRMLDRCVANNVGRVVFLSSGGTVYGNPVRVPIDEAHPTAPLCSYGIHKLAIEHYLHLYEMLHGLDYRVARVATSTGSARPARQPGADRDRPGEDRDGPAGAGLRQRRDGPRLHLRRRCGRAMMMLAERDTPSRVFNVGSGRGHTVMEIIRAVEAAMGKPAVLTHLPDRPLDVTRNELDTSLIRAETSWRPEVGLEEGIRRTVQWAPP